MPSFASEVSATKWSMSWLADTEKDKLGCLIISSGCTKNLLLGPLHPPPSYRWKRMAAVADRYIDSRRKDDPWLHRFYGTQELRCILMSNLSARCGTAVLFI